MTIPIRLLSSSICADIWTNKGNKMIKIIGIAVIIAGLMIGIATQPKSEILLAEREHLTVQAVPVAKAIVVTPAPEPVIEAEPVEVVAVEVEPIEEPQAVIANEVVEEPEEYHEEYIAPACELGERPMEYQGNYKITFYCPCETCNGGWHGTASGEPLTPGYTIATSEWAFGTTLYIENVGFRCVQDTGVPSGCIDVCVSSHEEALQLGVMLQDVYIVR